jgi:hypothetical protein
MRSKGAQALFREAPVRPGCDFKIIGQVWRPSCAQSVTGLGLGPRICGGIMSPTKTASPSSLKLAAPEPASCTEGRFRAGNGLKGQTGGRPLGLNGAGSDRPSANRSNGDRRTGPSANRPNGDGRLGDARQQTDRTEMEETVRQQTGQTEIGGQARQQTGRTATGGLAARQQTGLTELEAIGRQQTGQTEIGEPPVSKRLKRTHEPAVNRGNGNNPAR